MAAEIVGSMTCPDCRKRNDDATCMDPTSGAKFAPTEGDVSLCFYCGAVNLFTGVGLNVRSATPAERDRLLRSPDVILAALQLREFHQSSSD
jgi:hypothetical protein